MQKTFKESLLNQPISELDLSDEFKDAARQYQYHTLGDILRLKHPGDVLKHKEFNYHLFYEFTHILCENKLGHYLNSRSIGR